ncbi:phosphoglycolate phosphatase [Paraburkholderia phenoliruptrix]|uniref:phosphoglycolate phosphatase n=1 Tax=Paraburkholderia phenoliruptrix TaxID=252970 RepID=UPI0028698D28|nr:phosphoglycolate phosphatase [Paraburkholderia phenoliruptrix]WMY12225.1 phosphoglycolate phosphatase [Paraburkholderia phenoliruptrix]
MSMQPLLSPRSAELACALTRAVLIDLDGTMVHTAPDIVEAASRMLAEFGEAPLPFDVVSGFIGKGVPNLVTRTLEAAALAGHVDREAALAVFHRHYDETNGRFGHVYPHVEAGLRELRRLGYRLACVTNKPEALAARLLRITALASYLDVLVAGDSIDGMKPAPQPLWHACRLLGVEAGRSVMVGDSPVDVCAARAAGMPVWIVSYGYGGPDGATALQSDASIDSFMELPELLASQDERVIADPALPFSPPQ